MSVLDWMALNPRRAALVGIWLQAATLTINLAVLAMVVGLVAGWWK